jgi:tRNA(adenine34) deaminase
MGIAETDEAWMRRAVELALESEREGNLPVGALVVLDGQLIGQGHSAIVRPTYHPGRHAEIMALREVDDPLWPRAAEMTCYSTLEPCVMCAGTLLLHGVGRVVFGAIDRLGGASCILKHLPAYYADGGVYQWDGPILPDVCDPLYERTDRAFSKLPVGRMRLIR